MLKVVPFAGNGIYSKSAVVTRQRRLNIIFENREDGDKTQVALYGTPGLVQQFTIPGVARGLLGTESALYAVAANLFYSLSSSGSVLYSQSLTTGSGYVSMDFSDTQLMLTDGVYGYIYDGTSLSQITTGWFPNGAKTCTFVSDYFFAEQPGTQYVWASNTRDGKSGNALSFAAASQYSGNIIAVDKLAGNLLTFSQRHLQFWQNAATSPFPFQPILSAAVEYGLEAIWCRSHIDNSLIYLAHNPQGTVQVARVIGYTVEIISTPDLEQILNSWSTVSDMVSMAYVVNKHPIFQMTSPSQRRSFIYDCLSGIWSETQTGLAIQDRHTGNLATYYAGNTLVSDYAQGIVYQLSDTTYTDNGAPIIRELVTRHANQDHNEFEIDEVYLDFETGVGINSGQGSDPVVSLEVSKDNGRNFGTPRTASIGKMGKYNTEVFFRRFGSARDFVFRLRVTDPVKFAVTTAAISADMGLQ